MHEVLCTDRMSRHFEGVPNDSDNSCPAAPSRFAYATKQCANKHWHLTLQTENSAHDTK